MEKINLCALLGKAITDTEIQALLSFVKIKPESIKFKDDKFTAHGVNDKLGIELKFEKDFVISEYLKDASPRQPQSVADKIKEMESYPEGTLFFSSLIVRSNYVFDNGYTVAFPIRIEETITSELIDMMGQPLRTSEMFCSMMWHVEDYQYQVMYNEDTKKVRLISFPFLRS